MIQQDQQINDGKEKSTDGMMIDWEEKGEFLFLFCKDSSSRAYNESTGANQPKIRLQFKYDNGKLFVMVRYATNLVSLLIFIDIKYSFSCSH